jgi:cytochrome c553
MTRPLMIAASLALATLSLASLPRSAAAQDAEAPATAAPPASPQPTGSADAGKALTYTCMGCHGIVGYRNVYPTYHVPRIGGQSAVYLTNALQEYKNGARKHPTMRAQAQSFSDQDIADIAAFLSELTP